MSTCSRSLSGSAEHSSVSTGYKEQIAKDERNILHELSRNANKSINEIANNCGFSRQKVWRIIKNLEKNNTIWGYSAVVDERKQEKKGYIMLLKRTEQPIKKGVIDKIINRELVKETSESGVEIMNSTYTNGSYDWVICFNATDIKEAKQFVEGLRKVFKGSITDVQLLEKMFTVEKSGIQNPGIDGLREFFSF